MVPAVNQHNERYERQFRLGHSRPSNQVPPGFFDAATRRRIGSLIAWFDEEDRRALIRGAEDLLRGQAGRLDRRSVARAEGWVQGEPGE